MGLEKRNLAEAQDKDSKIATGNIFKDFKKVLNKCLQENTKAEQNNENNSSHESII